MDESTSPLHAIILGIIQGVSEFLPISSSGHLIIYSSLTQGKALPLALNVALHFGTLAAVLVYFHKDWLRLGKSVKEIATEGTLNSDTKVLIPALVVGSIPAAAVGLTFKDDIERLFHNPKSVAIPLIVVSFVMVLADKFSRKDRPIETLSVKTGFWIGLMQAVALIPGTSRSGITIAAGRISGFTKTDAAKFSFLLGTPAMFGAFILEASELVQYLSDPNFYIGVTTSFLTGVLSIKFLLKFLGKYGFMPFAIYRILTAIILLSL